MARSDFAAACRETARNMRRLPVELRRELRARVKPEVAEPLAADIRSAGTSVYARRVAGTVRVRAGADPTIVAGGAKRVASGGARGRDLVYGTEFGGGSRVTVVPAGHGHRGYRRRSTRQFRRPSPFIFRTVARREDTYLEKWADIVLDVIVKAVGRG